MTSISVGFLLFAPAAYAQCNGCVQPYEPYEYNGPYRRGGAMVGDIVGGAIGERLGGTIYGGTAGSFIGEQIGGSAGWIVDNSSALNQNSKTTYQRFDTPSTWMYGVSGTR